MGGIVVTDEAKTATRKVDAVLENEARNEQEKIKLLLLGAGESGKSTIFKQMKILYGTTFNEDERKAQTLTIYNNIIVAMKQLVRQSKLMEFESHLQPENQAAFDSFQAVSENDLITPAIGDAIKALWSDASIRLVWERRNEFHLIESVQFYFDRIDTIKAEDYIPSKEDILHNRVRTSGIITERYLIDNAIFEMYDVGGQRNERKKWMHCFEGVTAVIFVVGLSEFDQMLYEDSRTNRMIEALPLFDETCNNEHFIDSSFIVFFNKRDLFQVKIQSRSIKSVPGFEDFDGTEYDFHAGVEYFTRKFMEKSHLNRSRQIYHHVTCATDTHNVRVVFEACKDIVLRENIKNSGFSMFQ
jgi:GTPase SAR1 family protein